MKIGIIGAMEQEVAILKDKLNNLNTSIHASCNFYTGSLNGHEITLLQSGIGKVAAAIGTTIMIEQYNPDIIINTGSAGGFDSSLTMGDIVVSTASCYHDADVTVFGYKLGQMAGQPAVFKSDEKLVELTKTAIEQDKNKPHAVTGLIATGDAFVHSALQNEFIKANFPDVIAVEMEAGAIAQTCHQYQKPFVVIRAISDVADKKSPLTFDEFLPLAAKQSSNMIIKLLELL